MMLAFVGSAAIPVTRPLTKPFIVPLLREAGPMAVQVDVLSDGPRTGCSCVGAAILLVLGVQGVATWRRFCCGVPCPSAPDATDNRAIMVARQCDTLGSLFRLGVVFVMLISVTQLGRDVVRHFNVR